MSEETVLEQWLTVEQVAKKLQVHPETVRREIYRKNLRASKLRTAGWRISPADLKQYMDELANKWVA